MKAIVAAKAYVILYKRQIYRDIKICDHQGCGMKRFSGPCSFYIMVLLVRVSITAVKCHDQNQLGKERIISFNSLYSFHHPGKSGKEFKVGTWSRTDAEAMEECCCLACSWLALLALSSHPGELPHQSPIKKTP